MKKNFKWGSLLAVMAFLGLGAGNASAAIVYFDFLTQGEIDATGPCGPGCSLLETNGTVWSTPESSQGEPGLPEQTSWDFTGSMRFYQLGGIGGIGFGTGSGLGWSFTDESGAGNNLFGSFTTTLWGAVGDAVRYGAVHYVIEGGSGWFQGVTGTGFADLKLVDGKYFFEKGRMNVPEPGMTSLLAAGLGMFGFMAFRRRRQLPMNRQFSLLG